MGHENMTDDPDELLGILSILDKRIDDLEKKIRTLLDEREKVRAKIEKLKGGK